MKRRSATAIADFTAKVKNDGTVIFRTLNAKEPNKEI